MGVIVSKLVIVHQHQQTSRVHELELFIAYVLGKFMLYHLNESDYLFIVLIRVVLVLIALLELLEVQ